jgi:hypothetical protein
MAGRALPDPTGELARLDSADVSPQRHHRSRVWNSKDSSTGAADSIVRSKAASGAVIQIASARADPPADPGHRGAPGRRLHASPSPGPVGHGHDRETAVAGTVRCPRDSTHVQPERVDPPDAFDDGLRRSEVRVDRMSLTSSSADAGRLGCSGHRVPGWSTGFARTSIHASSGPTREEQAGVDVRLDVVRPGRTVPECDVPRLHASSPRSTRSGRSIMAHEHLGSCDRYRPIEMTQTVTCTLGAFPDTHPGGNYRDVVRDGGVRAWPGRSRAFRRDGSS